MHKEINISTDWEVEGWREGAEGELGSEIHMYICHISLETKSNVLTLLHK